MIKRVFALLLIVGGSLHLLSVAVFFFKQDIVRPGGVVFGVLMIAFGAWLASESKKTPADSPKQK